MKKFIALLCMLTCIFSLTACSGETEISAYQASKIEAAEQLAVNNVIPIMTMSVADQGIMTEDRYEYTNEEWEYVFREQLNMPIVGSAYVKALESFEKGLETMGDIISTGEVTSVVDDDTIIVTVDVAGVIKGGEVELIFSNDSFTELQSCTLNVDATFGELMTNAALNTVLGMGTVFAVLILIMFIIQALGIVSKAPVKKAPEKKEEVKAPAPAPAPVVEEADDLALVAVIAAAIASYEGKTSTDGFVVRSIKRAKRR